MWAPVSLHHLELDEVFGQLLGSRGKLGNTLFMCILSQSLISCECCMQDLAQCEHSLSNLGVSKKNVDHGAAGAEVPVKTLHTLFFIYWIFLYVIFISFCRLYPSKI